MNSRRITELESVHNNVRLLSDMLDQYQLGQTSAEELELIKELHQSCERFRLSVFRLASDTQDNESMLSEYEFSGYDELWKYAYTSISCYLTDIDVILHDPHVRMYWSMHTVAFVLSDWDVCHIEWYSHDMLQYAFTSSTSFLHIDIDVVLIDHHILKLCSMPLQALLLSCWNKYLTECSTYGFLHILRHFYKIVKCDCWLLYVCLAVYQSVRPSVCMEYIGSHWTDFHKIWFLSIFIGSFKKIQVSL